VIQQSAFPVEPWCVRERELDLDLLAQSESLFALSNGHIGMRGNLDEGEPQGIPGTYLNALFELRRMPYAEAGYGFPESGQTVVNVTNGKLIRLLVEDAPFDVRYGKLLGHERVLDLRAGTLTRNADWQSPAGRRVRVRSTRLVSFTHRAVAAIEYVVEAVDSTMRLIAQSELVANEPQPQRSGDPRAASEVDSPLVAVEQHVHDSGAHLVHRTRASERLIAAAMDHLVEAPSQVSAETTAADDWARTTFVCVLEPGQQLRIVKVLAYGWSAWRSQAALRDQVAAGLTSAMQTGYENLLAGQKEYLDDFWDGADVRVQGDPEVQQAVRFGLFHVLQAGARAEGRCLPAKGLTGPGYDGHTFWDAEAFVLPVLAYTQPSVVADELRWRHSTLDLARERATTL
jgi:alpha,alpha-trehalose phosphorylase